MTRRERIIAVVKHQQTDLCPYNIDFTHKEYEKVSQYLNDKDYGPDMWIPSSFMPTLPGKLFFIKELAGPFEAECN